ncbi:hypothetical protein KIN20_034408 [Parelaphostrongylus tenuis]|uniref:Regulator of microtubule dynamics protein 1 n=1 Tax=Parelaphostrongylus tenuis TaxID=148309 RepID=A0AAD5WJP5_PARTN|nr:hypothetical protein KIN20_034408 [Parelaphostrongylus tenuis]
MMVDNRFVRITGGVVVTATVAGCGVLGVLAYVRHLKSVHRELDLLSDTVRTLSFEMQTLRKELDELRTQKCSVSRTPVDSRQRSSGLALKADAGDCPSTSLGDNVRRRVTSYQSLTSDTEYADAEDEWEDEMERSSLQLLGNHVHLSPLSFAEVDQYFSSENVRQGYDMLKKRLDDGDKSSEVLWRLAKFCYELACRTSDKSKKKDLIFEGKAFALDGHCSNPGDFNSLKWAAIMTGQSTDYLGTKEKIEEGGKFKNLLDKALAVDQKEYSLRHMRGRYAFSVASLSWIERKAAAVFYSTPPTATLDEALEDFLSAYAEKPEWMENLMFIARVYLAKHDKQNAKVFLNKIVALAPCDEAEREMVQEATKLLAKC